MTRSEDLSERLGNLSIKEKFFGADFYLKKYGEDGINTFFYAAFLTFLALYYKEPKDARRYLYLGGSITPKNYADANICDLLKAMYYAFYADSVVTPAEQLALTKLHYLFVRMKKDAEPVDFVKVRELLQLIYKTHKPSPMFDLYLKRVLTGAKGTATDQPFITLDIGWAVKFFNRFYKTSDLSVLTTKHFASMVLSDLDIAQNDPKQTEKAVDVFRALDMKSKITYITRNSKPLSLSLSPDRQASNDDMKSIFNFYNENRNDVDLIKEITQYQYAQRYGDTERKVVMSLVSLCLQNSTNTKALAKLYINSFLSTNNTLRLLKESAVHYFSNMLASRYRIPMDEQLGMISDPKGFVNFCVVTGETSQSAIDTFADRFPSNWEAFSEVVDEESYWVMKAVDKVPMDQLKTFYTTHNSSVRSSCAKKCPIKDLPIFLADDDDSVITEALKRALPEHKNIIYKAYQKSLNAQSFHRYIRGELASKYVELTTPDDPRNLELLDAFASGAAVASVIINKIPFATLIKDVGARIANQQNTSYGSKQGTLQPALARIAKEGTSQEYLDFLERAGGLKELMKQNMNLILETAPVDILEKIIPDVQDGYTFARLPKQTYSKMLDTLPFKRGLELLMTKASSDWNLAASNSAQAVIEQLSKRPFPELQRYPGSLMEVYKKFGQSNKAYMKASIVGDNVIKDLETENKDYFSVSMLKRIKADKLQAAVKTNNYCSSGLTIPKLLEKGYKSPPLQIARIPLTAQSWWEAMQYIHSRMSPDKRHGDFTCKLISKFTNTGRSGDFVKFSDDPNRDNLHKETLFHGTGYLGATFILRTGFKICKGTLQKAGKAMGNGIYFAPFIDKSLQYLGDDGFTRKYGTRGFIFEAKVALGKRITDHKWDRDAGLNFASNEVVIFDANSQVSIEAIYELELMPQAYFTDLKKGKTSFEYEFKKMTSGEANG